MGAVEAEVQRPASSRESDAGAGWGCSPGTFASLLPENRPPPLYWFSAKVLWETRNDTLARVLSDPTDESRERWVEGLSDEDLTVDLSDRLRDFSFLLLGDTGEGDESQYALVPALRTIGAETAFMFICSDVLYPIGNVNDYGDKFYRPYTDYPGPIYAIPGNHDWYDGLEAFMRHFCGREPPPGLDRAAILSRVGMRERLWRKAAALDATRFDESIALRAQPSQRQPVPQRGPYFVIDTERLRLVGIDTGITKELDHAQGEWLLRVSAGSPKPKVLLTGTPIYVNNRYQPLEIVGGAGPYRTVDDIVRAAEHNYVAAIGGDIHNYQRYPVRVDGRRLEYVVSGGGGAFMHATHTIPRIDPKLAGGVTEDEFRCYPLRRDSLAVYSRLFDQKLRRLSRGRRVLQMTPDEAALLLSKRLGVAPTRPIRQRESPGWRARAAAAAVLLLPAERGFHKWLSPFFDWDYPPFFKNFLRLDVDERGLRIRCYGVTGCAAHEIEPPIEDEVPVIPLRPLEL